MPRNIVNKPHPTPNPDKAHTPGSTEKVGDPSSAQETRSSCVLSSRPRTTAHGSPCRRGRPTTLASTISIRSCLNRSSSPTPIPTWNRPDHRCVSLGTRPPLSSSRTGARRLGHRRSFAPSSQPRPTSSGRGTHAVPRLIVQTNPRLHWSPGPMMVRRVDSRCPISSSWSETNASGTWIPRKRTSSPSPPFRGARFFC